RHIGSFLPPTRVSLSLTDTCSSRSWTKPATESLDGSARAAHQRADVRHLAAPDLAHHLAHLAELLDQPVDLLHVGARAPRDAQPARSLDQLRLAPLLGCHREDDRLDPVELAF